SGQNIIVLRGEADAMAGGGDYSYAAFKILQPDQPALAVNGAHMVYEALCHQEVTSEAEGLSNLASFVAAADQLYNEGAGLCTAYDSSQETPWQFIQRICDAIGAACTQSRLDGL